MSIYQPTWLYIKQHSITGLKYFGKTTKDPYKYRGSGKYWLRHLAKYGANVITVWAKKFDDKNELLEFALRFSKENNIVESSDWANLIPENGLDGGANGRVLAETTREKIANSLRGRPSPKPKTEQTHINYVNGAKMGWERSRNYRTGDNHPMKNKRHTEDAKCRNADSNRNRPRFECPHCGKWCQKGTYNRWHGDKCKQNPQYFAAI